MKSIAVFSRYLIVLVLFFASHAHAEAPKTCQELSSKIFGTISDIFSRSDETLVAARVNLLTLCSAAKPLPADYYETSKEFSVYLMYMTADGTCYESGDNFRIHFDAGFNNLVLVDMAKGIGTCDLK